MRLLVDVDALCKLAHWQMLMDLPLFAGAAWADCATLESAKYRARRSVDDPDGRAFHSREAASIALQAIEQMEGSIEPDTDSLAKLQDLSGVDAGEAVLFASIAVRSTARLLTGDKRALRALASLPTSARAPYAGKIIVVEQIVVAALDKYGLDLIRRQVCPWKDLDIAVANAMGSRCDASEASLREGLQSYLKELTDLCSPSLIVPKL